MTDILKFVACLFLIVLLLTFTTPLLWLVIHMIEWLFGGVFVALFSAFSVWHIVLIMVIIAVVSLACD